MISHRGPVRLADLSAGDFADEVMLLLSEHLPDLDAHITPREEAAYDRARVPAQAGDDDALAEATTALWVAQFHAGLVVGAALAGLHAALTAHGRVCPRCEGMGCPSDDRGHCWDCRGGGVVGGPGVVERAEPRPPVARLDPTG